MHDMNATMAALLATGKGILAADESFPTIKKRFAALQIPDTEESRRDYREMLFTTPKLNEFISGVIQFDETIRQKTRSGASLSDTLAKQSIVPGIKVDEGTSGLAHFPGEKVTQGIDGLHDRLAEYSKLGALFTKWRAVITIGDKLPTQTCIDTNVTMLALYAAMSQEAGLVPIVEPEVLMDGNHTFGQSEEVITAVLKKLFTALFEHRVVLEHTLLKSGMVLSGTKCPQQAEVAEVVEATLRCFRRTVPAAVPGIVFLSGGQSELEATKRLNAICKASTGPWKITFSYGRALQNSSMKSWKGVDNSVPAGQAALHHRAQCNGLAVLGRYTDQVEGNAQPA